jgi:aspartate kinase
MRIYKFGGASVKSAEGVKNLAEIVANNLDKPLVVVVSAMGKITNELEQLSAETYQNKTIDQSKLDEVKRFHLDIINALFKEDHLIISHIENELANLEECCLKYLDRPYDFYYDQTVSYGEMVSTLIINAYLSEIGLNAQWVKASDIIKTNCTYREGIVDWNLSKPASDKYRPAKGEILITQGFLGGDTDGFITTLGREGSDYTAAILAYLFDADNVTIWKDVPGMMNADPKYFKKARMLKSISFREAIELSYFGAKVIHPKTLQPLKKKNIPLNVKSFIKPDDKGTIINSNPDYDRSFPSFIIMSDQILISITPLDFSFIIEENLSHIFSEFSKLGMKVHLMQNSAINFSVCVDANSDKVPKLIKALKESYKVKYNDKVELLTIRHFTQRIQNKLLKNKEILLEQKTRFTARFVIRDR